jgi:hypothetical protein
MAAKAPRKLLEDPAHHVVAQEGVEQLILRILAH